MSAGTGDGGGDGRTCDRCFNSKCAERYKDHHVNCKFFIVESQPKPQVILHPNGNERIRKHYSCKGCNNQLICKTFLTCLDKSDKDKHGNCQRKNWTPKPQPQVATPPGLLESQAHAWLTVYDLCETLGMKRDLERDGVSEVCRFVRGLIR